MHFGKSAILFVCSEFIFVQEVLVSMTATKEQDCVANFLAFNNKQKRGQYQTPINTNTMTLNFARQMRLLIRYTNKFRQHNLQHLSDDLESLKCTLLYTPHRITSRLILSCSTAQLEVSQLSSEKLNAELGFWYMERRNMFSLQYYTYL